MIAGVLVATFSSGMFGVYSNTISISFGQGFLPSSLIGGQASVEANLSPVDH